MRTATYSDFLGRIAALIGIESDSLQTPELAILNQFFRKNSKFIWNQTNWNDVCPYGEYATPNNLLSYPNRFTNPVWVASGITVEDNEMANPVSGNRDAAKMVTTAANSTIYQQFYPQSLYQNFAQVWLRTTTDTTIPLQVVRVSDSSIVYTQSFTLTKEWKLCVIPYTPLDLTPHKFQIGGSSMLSSGLTFYTWQAAAVDLAAQSGGLLIPFTQEWQDKVDIVYTVWKDPPFNPVSPRPVAFKLVPEGIKIYDQIQNYILTNNQTISVNSTSLPPLASYYIYYRRQVPDFTGPDYSDSDSYAVGDQVLFTDTDGSQDFWKCIVQTSVGSSPLTAPQNWELLEIPYAFLDYITYACYGDWLITEGQQAKSVAMMEYANTLFNQELEKQERQMGQPPPLRVATHLRSAHTLTYY